MGKIYCLNIYLKILRFLLNKRLESFESYGTVDSLRYFKIEIKNYNILILVDMIKVVSSEKFRLSNEALTSNRKLIPQQKNALHKLQKIESRKDKLKVIR